MSDGQFQPIVIRYDGMDAGRHEIELASLGQSLQGAAKLLGVAANYVATGRYVKKAPALAVRVLAREQRGNCFEIVAVITAIAPVVQPALPFFTELGSKAVEYIVTYILAKFGGRNSEMHRALDLLEAALKENGLTARTSIEAMRSTVELLATGQRPAAKMFVAPIGESCTTARLGSPQNEALEIDKATKDAITAPDPVEITNEREYRVFISELDINTGGCKISIEGDDDPERRYAGEITDPVVKLPHNAYSSAMDDQRWVNVRGKAQIKEGDIEKIYISNSV